MTDKEKLREIKELADAMYNAAQYLTTDASRLRKAMEKYHQFIINEYNKEEPVSEVWHDSNNEQPKDQRTVVILNPEEKSGEVLQRCLCVYENRIWAYLEDILTT